MRDRRQLYVLLGMAAWLTVAAWFAHRVPVYGGYISMDFGKFMVRMVTYSMPALLFGGILLWWFGKPKR
ncbi:MAG TPA: hypothetical protein VM182_15655 [Terriglobia bacterium]|nr:hypothetical protein [Terriglobia bacterium]